uniref:Cadherin N-terminal domain-containing protein n=1 Tax=Astyanax mexicanus TaxID=7994 RepID=A0A3B1JF43_ASTMX
MAFKGFFDLNWMLCFCLFVLVVNAANGDIRYTVAEESKPGTVVGNLAKDLSLSLADITSRNVRIASEAAKGVSDPGAGQRPRFSTPEQQCHSSCVYSGPE